MKAPARAPREGYAPLGRGEIYYREIGQGRPIIVLHGGPDFDHGYLRPDLDRLSDSYRLIYYDQRGRGRSARQVRPEDVTLESEIEDLERLGHYLELDSFGVLGHSWGGVLAMEFAIRHPLRVSHLILMNTAPASHADATLFRQERLRAAAGDMEKLRALSATARYQAGDLEAEAEYYRVHFHATLRSPERLEELIPRLRSHFKPEDVLRARAIENRLYAETWESSEYDLIPKLKRLDLPALILHGDYDFVPAACAARIAHAIPGARFVLLKGCGHFSYLERPEEVRREIAALM